MTEVWWVNAFVGPDAGGNSTCVVLEGSEPLDADRWAIAQSLRTPDTAFVAHEPRDQTWDVRFFSPYEGEMAFCGQGLIAVDAVLRASRAQDLWKDTIVLSTQAGSVSTRLDKTVEQRSWFDVDGERIRASSARIDVSQILQTASAVPPVIVDSGRRRLFQQLERVVDLQAVAVDPDEVLRFCREHQLMGICLYSLSDEARLALRVFTVSLAGREDASTGGAVLGLAALLPRGIWSVEQGHGHLLSRGSLMLDSTSSESHVAVGGRVHIAAVGQLVLRRTEQTTASAAV
jgi:PhzF family phenazine biosynthesis protein